MTGTHVNVWTGPKKCMMGAGKLLQPGTGQNQNNICPDNCIFPRKVASKIQNLILEPTNGAHSSEKLEQSHWNKILSRCAGTDISCVAASTEGTSADKHVLINTSKCPVIWRESVSRQRTAITRTHMRGLQLPRSPQLKSAELYNAASPHGFTVPHSTAEI